MLWFLQAARSLPESMRMHLLSFFEWPPIG